MVPSGGDAIKVEGRLTFSLKPNAPYRLDLAAWTLRRRPENVVDRWDGESFRRILSLENGPAEVEARQIGPIDSPRLRVAVAGAAATPETRAAVTSALERSLGLRVDLSEFERFGRPTRRPWSVCAGCEASGAGRLNMFCCVEWDGSTSSPATMWALATTLPVGSTWTSR
jgi:hypothetical protein